MSRKTVTLDKAIVDGAYAILRNLKGFNDEDVLNMPIPRFWLLLELLSKEMKEREKEMKKNKPKKHG